MGITLARTASPIGRSIAQLRNRTVGGTCHGCSAVDEDSTPGRAERAAATMSVLVDPDFTAPALRRASSGPPSEVRAAVDVDERTGQVARPP